MRKAEFEMTVETFGVGPEQVESLVRKMEKATDSYAKLDVFDEYDVDWGDRKPLLWALVREGHYAAWDDPAVWGELHDGVEHASAADIVAVLTKVERYDAVAKESGDEPQAEEFGDDYDDEYYEDEYYDDYGYDDYGGYEQPPYESPRLVAFWPSTLDDLAMVAYAEDAELVESKAAEMSPEVQKGLELVRRRFATNGKVDLPADTIEELSRVAVWSSLPWRVYDVVDGELVEAEIGRDDGEGPEVRARFLNKFATEEEWGQAVLERIFEESYGPNFRVTRPAWPLANAEQIEQMVRNISLHGQDFCAGVELMLQRDDKPADLVAMARRLNEDSRWIQAEFLVIVAALRAKALGEAAPDALDLLNFRAIGSSSKRSDYYVAKPYAEALHVWDEADVVDRIVDVFDGDYTAMTPFPILHAYRDNDRLFEKALAVIEREVASEKHNSYGLNAPHHGLAMMGAEVLPRLEAAYDDAELVGVKHVLRRAILGVLADAEEAFDAKYDRFISLTELDGESLDEHYVGHYVTPDYEAALESLPSDRAKAAIAADLRAEDGWIRTFRVLRKHAGEELFDLAFGRLSRDGMPTTNGFDYMSVFYDYDFRQAAKPYVGPALAASKSPDFHNLIKSRFGEDEYSEMLAEAGGESAADTSAAGKLRRLSAQMFEARPELDRTVVYIFSRTDEVPDETLNRIHGAPFGVDEWPLKDGDADEPMTHMFTLDLETTPRLKARFKDEVRAVSLFLRNPQHNSAWSPGNSETFVHFVMNDDTSEWSDELPKGHEAATGFTVEEVEVPVKAWTVGYGEDPELEAIRTEVYRQHAWVGGGGPIWLQSEEHFGMPVMQFDEGFIYTNLGDCGVMYVFTDTAFWQCH